MFGKICMTQPVDYDVPSMVSRAVAPNFGYIAQLFLVPRLAEASTRAQAAKATLFSRADGMHVPGLGTCDVAVVRSPGSGALVGLVATQ